MHARPDRERIPLHRVFLFTGLLGRFTTFPAFGLETIFLPRRGIRPMKGRSVPATPLKMALMSRHPLRTLLHLLLALALALPAIAAPAHDLAGMLSAAATAGAMGGVGDMPCGDMAMPVANGDAGAGSGDCCAPQCDLAACLGAACLFPPLTVVAATLPAEAPHAPAMVALRPRGPDNPLRPPIA